MDTSTKFINDLKNELLSQGLELPWQHQALSTAFWAVAPELTVDQAVRVARVVMSGYEFGIEHGRHKERTGE